MQLNLAAARIHTLTSARVTETKVCVRVHACVCVCVCVSEQKHQLAECFKGSDRLLTPCYLKAYAGNIYWVY